MHDRAEVELQVIHAEFIELQFVHTLERLIYAPETHEKWMLDDEQLTARVLASEHSEQIEPLRK
jgi:hypothetical protein